MERMIWVKEEVLDTIQKHTRGKDVEVFGLLLGKYSPRFQNLNISIAVPAQKTNATEKEVKPKVMEWVKMRARAKLARIPIVGWYHSHLKGSAAFSRKDVEVHRAYFKKRHQIALVYSKATDKIGLMGWDGDQIVGIPKVFLIPRGAFEIEP